MAIVFGPNYTAAGQELGTNFGKALLDAQTQESIQQARNVAAEHQVNLKNAFEILRTYAADEQTMTPDGRVVGHDGKPVDPITQQWRQQLTEWAANYIQNSGPTQVWRGYKQQDGRWQTGRTGNLSQFPPAPNPLRQQAKGMSSTSNPPTKPVYRNKWGK